MSNATTAASIQGILDICTETVRNERGGLVPEDVNLKGYRDELLAETGVDLYSREARFGLATAVAFLTGLSALDPMFGLVASQAVKVTGEALGVFTLLGEGLLPPEAATGAITPDAVSSLIS